MEDLEEESVIGSRGEMQIRTADGRATDIFDYGRRAADGLMMSSLRRGLC